MRTILAIAAACLLCAASASAQAVPDAGKLKANDSLEITWPAATVNPDGLNAPTGYKVRATSTTQTGVVIREWDAAATARLLLLAPTQLPEGGFTVTVHPFNGRGVAGSSNTIGPFGREATPNPVTGASGRVVAGAP